jgi:hypothetical protein
MFVQQIHVTMEDHAIQVALLLRVFVHHRLLVYFAIYLKRRLHFRSVSFWCLINFQKSIII